MLNLKNLWRFCLIWAKFGQDMTKIKKVCFEKKFEIVKALKQNRSNWGGGGYEWGCDGGFDGGCGDADGGSGGVGKFSYHHI